LRGKEKQCPFFDDATNERCSNQKYGNRRFCKQHDVRVICSVDGCLKNAVKSGLCCVHGAPTPLCSIYDCDKTVYKDRKCWSHYHKKDDETIMDRQAAAARLGSTRDQLAKMQTEYDNLQKRYDQLLAEKAEIDNCRKNLRQELQTLYVKCGEQEAEINQYKATHRKPEAKFEEALEEATNECILYREKVSNLQSVIDKKDELIDVLLQIRDLQDLRANVSNDDPMYSEICRDYEFLKQIMDNIQQDLLK
jgi:uncharacterized coiled-coil DUF342 family protein